MLNTITTGEGPGTPVLLVHGLFGQGRNLGGIARRLAQGRAVISVDMRNHGDSFHDDDHSYPALATDLAQVVETQGGRMDIVGHSMGGKAAMMLALTRPDLIERLAVLDIAPVSYGHSQAGYIDMMEALDLTDLDRRSQADKRLAEILHAPSLRAFFLQSLDLKAQPARWTLNLRVLREQMDLLVGWPGEAVAGKQFAGPALFLAGVDSDYVDSAAEAEISRFFPNAEIQRIAGAGHWLHADRPEETAEAVAAFLARD